MHGVNVVDILLLAIFVIPAEYAMGYLISYFIVKANTKTTPVNKKAVHLGATAWTVLGILFWVMNKL